MSEIDAAEFKMPFGKHKGETLQEVYVEDEAYLRWCADNLENDDVRERIEVYLEEMNSAPRYR